MCKRKIDSPFIRMEDNTCPVCIKDLASAAEEEKLRLIELEEERKRKEKIQAEKEKARAKELEEERKRKEKIQAEKEKARAKELEEERKRKEKIQIEKRISDSDGVFVGKEVVKADDPPPQIIEILQIIGWVLLFLSCLAGLGFILPGNSFVIGFALIVSGVIQCALFNGFALIIKELIEIRKNTASD